jgi:hypothetical protein
MKSSAQKRRSPGASTIVDGRPGWSDMVIPLPVQC